MVSVKSPVGKRRERQKADTRETILDSARFLFETQGFEKTTMRAVAIRAEIGLGTIYKHFINKAELLVAALLGDLTRLYDSAMAGIPKDEPVKAQFLHIARRFYTYYTSRPALTRAYLTRLFTIKSPGFTAINAFDEAYAEKIRELISQAQEKGEISPDKDCAFVAMVFMADYFFVLTTFILRYNEADAEKMLGVLEKMLDQTIP